ncbi:hypothetical protein [Bacillus alkalicellulosilyticus]|nr:hypothetical protein [Bacillus alkalicellulosilyticus]
MEKRKKVYGYSSEKYPIKAKQPVLKTTGTIKRKGVEVKGCCGKKV